MPRPSNKKKTAADGAAGSADESLKAVKSSAQAAGQDINRPASTTGNKASENGAAAADADSRKNAYIRDIEKRLAKVTKKQRQIETVEAKIAHLPENEKDKTTLINKDERAKINNKASVLAQVKEYNDILQAFTAIAAEEDKSRDTEKSTQESELAQKIEAAKEEGKGEGAQQQRFVMQTLLKFLRLAGYRRASPGGEQADNDAIEKVLIMVYSSEEAAFEAAENIAAGSDKVIEDTEGITYHRIKEIADNEFGFVGEAENVEAPAEETAVPSTQEVSGSGEPEVPTSLDSSTVIVTEKDLVPENQGIPAQTLTSSELANGGAADVPSSTVVDNVNTANPAAAAAQVEPVRDNLGMVKAPEFVPSGEGWGSDVVAVPTGGDSWDNGAAATAATNNNGGNWADESHDAAQTGGDASGANDANDGGFKEVPLRHGGRGGRGSGYRGNRGFRGDGSGYRGRGGFRGERGGYRGRGGDRGDRSGGYRGRGDRERFDRGGGYRGGWNRDNRDNQQHQQHHQPHQQQPQGNEGAAA